MAELVTAYVFLGYVAMFIIGGVTFLVFRPYVKKYWLDINKVWSISLNSNTMLGSVKLVKPTVDGLKTRRGYEVPTEINFAFRDRYAGNPIFVWDEDTGLLVRPMAGETEQSDPAVKDAKNIREAVTVIKEASGFPWNMAIMALLVLAVIAIIGLYFISGGLGGG